MATTTTPAAGIDAIGSETRWTPVRRHVERPIGARVRRKEDPRFLTGRGLYTDDVRLPGTVHAAFVRSPHAHARIVGIDLTPRARLQAWSRSTRERISRTAA